MGLEKAAHDFFGSIALITVPLILLLIRAFLGGSGL
jgi:hypothetical protein